MAGMDLSCSRQATDGQIIGDVVRRRLLALSRGITPEDLDLLTLGYLRDLGAHDEVEAQDTLAVEDPPVVVNRVEKRRGPKARPAPDPEALRAALLGRPTERWGAENSASDLDDDALIFRLCYVALHKQRLSGRDLDLQEEFCERRGLNYPALTSARSSFLGRGLPDALRPRLGVNRSRIRREIVAVLLLCSARRKTGATLSVLEWAMLLFASKSAISEHLSWLEERGFLIVVPRYVPATHIAMPVEHRTNFYTLGPQLLALRELWDRPHHQNAAKAEASVALQVQRRRHKFRILRGRHVPQAYITPEEWLQTKAGSDVSALVQDELQRCRQAHLAAKGADATREAAAQLMAGCSGGDVIRAMLDVRARIDEEINNVRLVFPLEQLRGLLAEHDAAVRLVDDENLPDDRTDRTAFADEIAAAVDDHLEALGLFDDEGEHVGVEVDEEVAGDVDALEVDGEDAASDVDDAVDVDAADVDAAASDALEVDAADVDDEALAGDAGDVDALEVEVGEDADDAVDVDAADVDAAASDALEVDAADVDDEALAGESVDEALALDEDALDEAGDALALDEALADLDVSNYEIRKPFRPLTGPLGQTVKAPPLFSGERPHAPASRGAADVADPQELGSVAPPQTLVRPWPLGGAPCAQVCRGDDTVPSTVLKQSGRMQPVSKDRLHASEISKPAPLNLQELARAADKAPPREPRQQRLTRSPREAAEVELLRAIAQASAQVKARLRRDGGGGGGGDSDPPESR